MRRVLIISLAIMLLPPSLWGGSTVGPIPMNAQVPAMLELDATIYQGDVGGPVVTSMDFGMLVDSDGDGTLEAATYFTVHLTAKTSGRQYEIRQSANALQASAGVGMGGPSTLSPGACLVVPIDNGVILPGKLGPPGSWAVTDKVIYTSETAGSSQTVGAVYSIGGSPRGMVPMNRVSVDQPAGDYSGTVTFTVVLL